MRSQLTKTCRCGWPMARHAEMCRACRRALQLSEALDPEQTKARFLAKVVTSDGCWRWSGGFNSAGYATFFHSGRKRYAHRYSYELFVGPIPDGLELDHLCRNTRCINPAHLEAVTHTENVLRGQSIQAQLARQTHCKRGHPFDEKNTYINHRGHRQCRACHLQRDALDRAKKRAAKVTAEGSTRLCACPPSVRVQGDDPSTCYRCSARVSESFDLIRGSRGYAPTEWLA